MTIDLSQLVLLGVLCAATHWLVARSEIARPLWSRATGWLGKLLACAGCSGFWLGSAAWSLGVRVTPLDARHGGLAISMILGTFITPVFEGLLLWGLRESAIHTTAEIDYSVYASDPPPPSPNMTTDTYVTPVDNPIRRVPK